jgi:hypothetical protein
MLTRLPTILLMAWWLSFASAQGVSLLPAFPTGPDPEVVADGAINVWLTREIVPFAELTRLPPEALCEQLPALLNQPPPPPGTRVLLEDRLLLDDEDAADAGRRTYTYAAVRSTDVLDVVQVVVVKEGDLWRVEQVGFRPTEGTAPRAWLQTPTTDLAFLAFTLLVLLALLRPSPLRQGLRLARQVVAAHRRTVAFTMVALSLVFVAGMGAGGTLPDGCDEAVLTVVEGAVTQLGATSAYGSGIWARAAALTFYQNFVVVTFSVHFFLVLMLGVPSYLLAGLQFFALGIPFGVLPVADLGLPVLLLVLLELSAYFLVISGGGILVGDLFRHGFRGYLPAVRKAALLLIPAAVLLLAGAWYEAILLIGF